MLTRILTRNHIFIAALALLISAPSVDAQGTAFTYQGKLTDSDNLAAGDVSARPGLPGDEAKEVKEMDF